MSRRRLLAWLSGAAAAVCLFVGGAALEWYLWDVAIMESGNPDRSMLFWGLLMVFIGIAALAAASDSVCWHDRCFVNGPHPDGQIQRPRPAGK
jgi:hypothetical protein